MTNTLALVADGKARLIRPRKGKGSPTEVFAQFLIPDGADDDTVARLAFQMMDLLTLPNDAAPAATSPSPTDSAPARRSAARGPGGRRPLIRRSEVIEALRKANAVDQDTALRPEALRRALGNPPADQLGRAITRLASEGGVVVAGRTKARRIWLPADSTPRVEPDPNEGVPVVAVPPAVTGYLGAAAALADGGVPWGGGERPAD